MSTQATVETNQEKFAITVPVPAEFPNLIEANLITSTELMEKISELFSAAYKDFVGCFLSPRVNGGGFDLKLYFCAPAVDNNGATYAFELTGATQRQQSKTGLIAGLVTLEKRSSQRLYSLTQHGREGLEDFLLLPKNAKPDWNKFAQEEMQNSNINQGVYATVIGLDVIKVIAAIYGEKKDGQYLQYQLTPIRPVNQNGPASSLDWIIQIQRLGMKELDRVSRRVGMVQNGGIPMVGRQ